MPVASGPAFESQAMWYFAWVLGVGFAVLLAIMNSMWGETEDARRVSNEAGD
ncbi:MAG: cytochrome bd-I oxidase subunit CydX [Bradyrhizobium sp.]